ncbi:hypothetical protein [Baekduia sp. Peel2402]|uniref:hypothetical protein n=1 Tax=Baekduia sp. Peel2402 TaxID=3458296 RepID=UPI00403E63C6
MAEKIVTHGAREAPRLKRCAVLFLDLLGVQAMNQGSREDVERRLAALDDAFAETFRQYAGPFAEFPAVFFSDTLVVAAPADDPAVAVDVLVRDAAELQRALTLRGFFVRGGLSLGLFHMSEGLIFGPALVEAYELECRVAVHPRIVLSKEAELALPRSATRVMRDGDGRAFVNYLDRLFDRVEQPDADIEKHREAVTRRLVAHRGDHRIWEKYRWSAEYHNAFVVQSGIADMAVDEDATAWRFARFAA